MVTVQRLGSIIEHRMVSFRSGEAMTFSAYQDQSGGKQPGNDRLELNKDVEDEMRQIGKYQRSQYVNRGSVLEIINSFSIGKMYNFLAGTRCKPWDNRELDAFDGVKVFSFAVATIGQAGCCLLITWFYNVFNVFSILRSLLGCMITMANIGMEPFFFISTFFTVYRCMMIMDAKEKTLDLADWFKIVMRKFFRLAPVYYSCWIIMWALTPYVVQGALSYVSNNNMTSCSSDWVSTMFMASNLSFTITPYMGCYQSAWPLQVDLQLTLITPILAMIIWKSRILGMLVCTLLIVSNMAINYYLSIKYQLKIGLVDAHNYELLSKLVSKPWTHLANVGMGAMLATLYYEILVFRRVDSETAKITFFPWIYRLHKSRFIGMVLVAVGLLLVTLNLVGTRANQEDPNRAS